MINNKKCVHFVGIAGTGQSGIAYILNKLGFIVSGSDIISNQATERLSEQGVRFFLGHHKNNIKGSDILVVSSAVPEDNPEVQEARRKNIPVVHRADMLSILMRTKNGIAIAGTHGKTTTTAMISLLLKKNGFNPTVLIGGEFEEMGGNAELGDGEYLVAEADESDGSFLKLSPLISIITNIEEDHLEYLKNIKNIISIFKKFINKLPKDGLLVACGDDLNIKKILPQIKRNYITYGIDGKNNITAKNISLFKNYSLFDIYKNSKFLGKVKLKTIGLHNVYNSLAAISVGLYLNIDFKNIINVLAKFSGVERRFQLIGKPKGIVVIDDYAHHPTEIKATLCCARMQTKNKVIAVFQPHRYTRTKFLEQEFAKAFTDADIIIVQEIYSASEKPIQGVSSKNLAEKIKSVEGKNKNKIVKYIPQREQIVDYLCKTARKNDLVLTIGAGDVYKVAKDFVERVSQ